MMDLSFSSFCPLIYNLISSLVLLCIIVTGSFVFYLIRDNMPARCRGLIKQMYLIVL
jgi:hypothetical protein